VAPNSPDRRAAVTVERLVDVPELDLRLLSGPAHAEIDWVHSFDLADPTPFLAPGNLLLTTGQQFASAAVPEAYLGYVQRLVGVGVRAVGFGTDVVRSGTPQDLVAACLSCGLPLLEVPYRTPFIAISRWVADALAAHARERDLWTLRAQRAVALAGLSQGRLVAVLDELARQLEASVALLDGHGNRLSVHGTARPDWSGLEVEARRLLERGLRGGSSLTGEDGVGTLQTLGRRDALRGVPGW
jgi:purine catabolism regulator